MSFFDILHSQQSANSNELARRRRRKARQARRRNGRTRQRIDELEEDVQTLALILGGVMRQLDKQGTLTREDMRASIAALDEVDGQEDGKLELHVLKEMTA